MNIESARLSVQNLYMNLETNDHRWLRLGRWRRRAWWQAWLVPPVRCWTAAPQICGCDWAGYSHLLWERHPRCSEPRCCSPGLNLHNLPVVLFGRVQCNPTTHLQRPLTAWVQVVEEGLQGYEVPQPDLEALHKQLADFGRARIESAAREAANTALPRMKERFTEVLYQSLLLLLNFPCRQPRAPLPTHSSPTWAHKICDLVACMRVVCA